MTYEVVRTGIDTLEVSLQGILPELLLTTLEQARRMAKEERQPKAVEFAKGVVMHVGEAGAQGGYSYVCDSGPEGEFWLFKNDHKQDWNVRVKVKAANLAANGWEACKARIYDVCYLLGIRVTEESIARVDFAIDFTAPADFAINPHLMVAHARSTRKEDGIKHEEFGGWKVYTNGRKTESVTIGKMPNRQLIIYDKSREIKDNGKAYWWKVFGVPAGTQVYRLECRFGKKYLKEVCGISKWPDLEKHLPALVREMLEAVRMVDPNHMGGKNVSRWRSHALWVAVRNHMRERFDEWQNARPVAVVEGERERLATIMGKQIKGSLISFAQVAGVDEADFERFLQDILKGDVVEWKDRYPGEFIQKWQKAGDKYRLLTGETWSTDHE